jgi:hypothetical protein
LFASGKWWKIGSLSITSQGKKKCSEVKPHDDTPLKRVKLIGIKNNSS